MIESSPLRSTGKLKSLPVERLERGPLQPRRVIDGAALKRLAESIRTAGVIQPIFVRRKQRGRFEIIAGERRWHAARIAGLRQIPTVISDVSDESALAIALIENLHREDLNPMDQAAAMSQLIVQFGMTHQEVADTIGKSRAAVSNLVRLLELPEPVRDMVADGELDMGHARALLSLPEDQREDSARYVAGRNLSVRDVEAMVKRARRRDSEPESDEGGKKAAPSRISMRHEADGGYRVEFSFDTPAELDDAIEELRAYSRQLKQAARKAAEG